LKERLGTPPPRSGSPPRFRALGGSRVSGLYEVASWLVYALAAVMMLTVSVAAVLAGLALRVVAEFLRELCNGDKGSGAQEDRKDLGA
jgi:hypothetical protein